MTNYKSYRFVDRKARWVIVDEDGKIINKDPNREQLKIQELEIYVTDYRPNRCKKEMCDICGKKVKPGKALREYDKNGNCTKKWLCRNCYIAHNADCRNKNLDPDCGVGKGYITEVLVAKFLGINTCFDITGNFNHKAFDMYEHEYFGRINVKGSSLHSYNGYLTWYFGIYKNIIPDFFFCICYDKDMKNVESVYIIQNKEYIYKLKTLAIYKDRQSIWDKFKESEEEVKKWNDLFHTLKLENCPVLRKIGSKKTSEKKKIRAYKERMREKYKRDILMMPNDD